MMYEFIDTETGERREFDFRMADAPPLDSEIERGGRRYRRVVSLPRAAVESDQGQPTVSMPDDLCDVHGMGTDRNGNRVFHNKRHARDFARKTQDDPARYGGGRTWSFDG